MARQNARKVLSLFVGAVLLLCGALVTSLVLAHVGNEKEWVLRGQQTNVHLQIANPTVYIGSLPKPWISLGDVKAQAEDWQEAQRFANPTQVRNGAFVSGPNRGYYDFIKTKSPSGKTGQSQTLFFLRGGKSYRLSFWFTDSNSPADQALVTTTWKTVQDQLGLSGTALPPIQ